MHTNEFIQVTGLTRSQVFRWTHNNILTPTHPGWKSGHQHIWSDEDCYVATILSKLCHQFDDHDLLEEIVRVIRRRDPHDDCLVIINGNTVLTSRYENLHFEDKKLITVVKL